MAQSNLTLGNSSDVEVQRPSSFQRALEERLDGRRTIARGAIRVMTVGDASDLKMEQRVDALKQQFDDLSMDERQSLMNKLQGNDPELYEAVVARITGRSEEIRESLAQVSSIGDVGQGLEDDIHAAMNTVSKRAAGVLGGFLKKA